MRYFTLKFIFVFLLLGIFCSSCVSKKNHLATIQSLRTTNDNIVADWQSKVIEKRKEVNDANKEIESLQLQLAERKGENNILVQLRDELQNQIISMESRISNQGTKAQTTQKTLSSQLSAKDREISSLKSQLRAVDIVLVEHQDLLKKVMSDIAFEMQSFGNPNVEVTTTFNEVKIIVPEIALFKSKSATRLTDSGLALLQRISRVLNKYPTFYTQVVGHTDTTQPDRKKYKDNWNFSALASASIVRTLISDYDMNSSQVSVGAKGEYEPRDTNATREGKLKNRRLEFVISRQGEDLAKEVKKVIGVR